MMRLRLARLIEGHRVLLIRLVLSFVLTVSVDRILSATRLRGGAREAALFLIWFGVLWVGDTIRQSWRSQQEPEDPAGRQ